MFLELRRLHKTHKKLVKGENKVNFAALKIKFITADKEILRKSYVIKHVLKR
jgi:hypothetical protein